MNDRSAAPSWGPDTVSRVVRACLLTAGVVLLTVQSQSAVWLLLMPLVAVIILRPAKEPPVADTPPANAPAMFAPVPGVPAEIQAEIDAREAANFPVTATVARTPTELRTLIDDKPRGWPWAVFASVLLQRRDAVAKRLRDNRLGFAHPSGQYARSDWEVVTFATERMDELLRHAGELETLMLSPAFRELL